MKNRLVITVSDAKSTKSYNVHQFIKKFFAIIVAFICVIIGGSFWFISELKDDIEEIKVEKENALIVLKDEKEKALLVLRDDISDIKKEKEKALLVLKEQNFKYTEEMNNKIRDIEALSSKLNDIEEIIGLKKDDEASLIQRLTLAKLTSEQKMYMLQSIPNGNPIKNVKVTSRYGYRINPVSKRKQLHKGIDLKAKYNTKIYATADGVVKYVQSRNIGASGRIIKIAHNFGFETIYAHLNKTKVKIGDIVKKGQYIGLTGNSGRSTGPHLHYEVSYASKSLNPVDYMKWDLENYESIFSKQRRVQWESLVSLINNHHSKMVQQ